MNLTGQLLIGSRDVDHPGASYYAFNPATREKLEPAFHSALASDVDLACELAADAFDTYRATAAEHRAMFLEHIAVAIEATQGSLIQRAMLETSLPQARLESECARTCGQLRMFAHVIRNGLWRKVALDSAQPDRHPTPRPDLRMHQIAIGPVAVFGASNFPLAFSVAGGDTVSALAAGCPVIVKAHPAHPGTCELVARAVRRAALECRLPEGVFSMLGGDSHEVGKALVAHATIQAVGFTGSRAGGLALLRIAQSRTQPIPVYAEMSSINPMFILPVALAERPERIAQEFVESLALGVGQFCTNPGLVVGVAGPDWNRFIAAVTKAVEAKSPGTLLTESIHRAYNEGTAFLSTVPKVRLVAQGGGTSPDGYQARVMVHETVAENFLATPELENEIFGPSSLLVRCDDISQLQTIARCLSGQLTITLQMQQNDALDLKTAATLMPVLERKAGRILANGYPTGVEVGYAMVHGGPYPATSDSRSTSVGASAISRFLRPVCYQNIPDSLLPADLRRDNVESAWRLVDGTLTAPTAGRS